MMEPVYWEGESLVYQENPERIYCKAIDNKGKQCPYRAADKKTHLCGIHNKFPIDAFLISYKKVKIPIANRPSWLMSSK